MNVHRVASHSPSHRRWGASGQAMVEFTLVTLLFFPVFFGIVEFALIMASIGSFNFATREGARIGALVGPTDANAATDYIIPAITQHVKSIVMAQAQEVDIYRADPNTAGNCLTGASPPSLPSVPIGTSGCEEDCFTITAGTVSSSSCPGGTAPWPPSTWNASEGGADYLGVRVLYQYTFLTGFVASFGSTLNLSAYSVQRIEPLTISRVGTAAPTLYNIAPHGGLAQRSAVSFLPVMPVTQAAIRKPDDRQGAQEGEPG